MEQQPTSRSLTAQFKLERDGVGAHIHANDVKSNLPIYMVYNQKIVDDIAAIRILQQDLSKNYREH